ncbi:hypothetical protein HYH03_001848 [Edaphochlamys debaryana]|uniref:Peptidase M11 gametolysin domain-containing protein n=1 Tax=Edaphochlamys debaryana TaxID=47281 RepID=A0A835YKJ5_9CHLO|nr:hypothetical protein HYH03_001848 [Edaphochlamys debaryana]|eukprot:KAG2500270.1 hypothetical protein HYH03_001848 [Edaphochlamys debaryana]
MNDTTMIAYDCIPSLPPPSITSRSTSPPPSPSPARSPPPLRFPPPKRSPLPVLSPPPNRSPPPSTRYPPPKRSPPPAQSPPPKRSPPPPLRSPPSARSPPPFRLTPPNRSPPPPLRSPPRPLRSPPPVRSPPPFRLTPPNRSPPSPSSAGSDGGIDPNDVDPRYAELPPTVWPKDPPSPPASHTMTVVILALDICGRKSAVNYDVYQAALSSALPNYYETASFGAYRFPTGSSYNRVVFTNVPVGCSALNNAGLDFDAKREAWADEADAWVVRNLNVNVYNYLHHVYLIPQDIGGGGSGLINCYNFKTKVRAYAVSSTTDPGLKTLLHEMGHNMGLSHSRGYDDNGNIQEYGDGSCVMGSTTRPVMFNAPQSVALGWTVPQAVWRGSDLPAGKWTPFTLRGLADSRISSLKILPGDWMNGNGDWDDNEHLFISFRRYNASGVEAGLRPDFWNKVQVHRYSLNTWFEPRCGGVLSLANLDLATQPVWPKPGSTNPADTTSPLLAVRVTRIDLVGAAAYISVCRAQSKSREGGAQCSDGLDNDCDGRVDNC